MNYYKLYERSDIVNQILRLIYSLYNIEPLIQAICFNHVTSGKENQFVESVLHFLLFSSSFWPAVFAFRWNWFLRLLIRLKILTLYLGLFINFAINNFKPFPEIGASESLAVMVDHPQHQCPSSPTTPSESLGRVFGTKFRPRKFRPPNL